MTTVTAWFRDEGRGWEYNHYQTGYDPDLLIPEPLHESHKRSWKNGFWWGKKAELTNDLPPKLIVEVL